MAVALTIQPTNDIPRAWSVGPYRMEVYSFTAATGDSSVVVTSSNLNIVNFGILSGALQTAAASVSGKVATFTITAAGDKFGQIILLGK